MFSQQILFAVLSASTTFAFPSALMKRDDIESPPWGDGKGNIKLVFGQGTVDLGDITIEALFDKIIPICHTSGQCEQNDINTDGWWIEEGLDGDMEPITVTMKPSGEFPTWIHNGLLDILKASVIEIADCRDVTNVQADGGSGTRTTQRQCLVPSFWGVNYQADSDAAPPNIAVTVTSRENTEESPCKTALETLGGLAGVISGVAGETFSLLSLTCQA